MSPRPRPRPRSITSLYSLSGASSLTSIISTPTKPSASRSTSRSPSPSSIATNPNPSPNDNNPTPPPSEFIFPIPSSGDPSETSPLLSTPHRCLPRKLCICRHPNYTTHLHQTASTIQPTFNHFRHCSIQRSSLLNIQIISGTLLIFCLAIIILSPFPTHIENKNSALQRDIQSSHKCSTLASLHSPDDLINTNFSVQAQTQKLDTPQLKGIEFAIVCFAIFVICSIMRATSYVMSRWGVCFGGEGSDGNGDIFEEAEEEMLGYSHRRESMQDNIV
ncbi:uncharacterized protein EAE98_006108 [Botrytis deweyae]|uniref:Copper transporter n=1 Tax=Botrytis deweyae TaxID=2478750 RepID=A0ABQ7IM53_9HELO|nr:uncharacterized protein EAE98_006108 [Botrytis deweyae]KAF7927726.1 hypothetical protein EAE98_006108 [Botrytis deweyae]